MLKNYFLVALRTFRRNKTFSFINIAGLAIGISASLVIFLLVQYDFSFDKFEKDGARIYRVVNYGKNDNGAWQSGCLAEPMGAAARKEVTGLELVAPIRTLDEVRVTVPYPNANSPVVFRKQKDVLAADESYFNLLSYTWLAGSSATATQQPYQVVLTEKRARLYYGKTKYPDIIGKVIVFDDTIRCTVTGIVKDLPGNSDFYFGTFISRPTYYTGRLQPESFGKWGWINSADQLFVRLLPGIKPAAVEAQLTRILNNAGGKPDPKSHSTVAAGLQPLSDLHFNLDYGVFDESRQAHKPTLYSLLAVAAFLLLLAAINFINLTTAQASQRAREIGIRKTMGSHRRQLIVQFLTETFVLTLLATVLSLILLPFLLEIFADFIPEDFHFNLLQQPEIIGFLLVLVIVVTFLSGVYPALVLSGFKPVLVLKNQAFANGQTRSAWLRKSLTVSQFVIAQVFIIGTILVSRQISYALNKDLGFKRDAIVYFRVNDRDVAEKKAVLLDKLRAMPTIALVSIASDPPSSNGTWTSSMVVNNGKKEVHGNVEVKLADSNYFRMYSLRLLAGTSAPQSDTTNAVVINESFLHLLGFQDPQMAIARQITEFNGNPHIVGVVADFFPHSLRDPIKPLVVANGTKRANVINIKLQPRTADGSNWPSTIAAVQKAFHAVYPNDDFDYQFVDDTIAKYYTAERNIARLLAWATGLTIFISCLGLLGLVIYVTNQRTKEIGIRKVIGATVTNLIVLLSRDFLKLIGLAILIAVPIAWWGSRKWLENFAYKTALSWWIFAAGGATLLLIALIILCIRTLRAALANPVDSLRTE